jgi:glutamate-ammonia-ligase adenylyltransferase
VQSFKTYQQEQAWTWEHLALTRARPVAGHATLQQEIEGFRANLLAKESDPEGIKADVADMRARIAEAKSPEGRFDAKIGAGRLQDIELTAQTAALLAGSPDRKISTALEAGVAIGWLDAAQSKALGAAYDVCWRIQTAGKLLSEKPLDPEAIGAGGRSFLARETGCDDIRALETLFKDRTARAAEIIETLLGAHERTKNDDG